MGDPKTHFVSFVNSIPLMFCLSSRAELPSRRNSSDVLFCTASLSSSVAILTSSLGVSLSESESSVTWACKEVYSN